MKKRTIRIITLTIFAQIVVPGAGSELAALTRILVPTLSVAATISSALLPTVVAHIAADASQFHLNPAAMLPRGRDGALCGDRMARKRDNTTCCLQRKTRLRLEP